MPDSDALPLPADAFGDPFVIERLPLPRPANGYAVQWLDSDRLLDIASGEFLPVRDPRLQGLHPSFASAFNAARDWQDRHAPSAAPLAIVPAAYDREMQRHILIYGALPPDPAPKRDYCRS